MAEPVDSKLGAPDTEQPAPVAERSQEAEAAEQPLQVDARVVPTVPVPTHGYSLRPPRSTTAEPGGRGAARVLITERHVYNMTVAEAIEKRGTALAMEASKAELRQLHERKAFVGIKPAAVKKLPRAKILPCKLFLKDKKSPSGVIEKLKARLVAGGHRQDYADYEGVASPTVSTTSLFTVLAISAKQGRKRMTTDITGAYLNARRKSDMERVYMRLNKGEHCYYVRCRSLVERVHSRGWIIGGGSAESPVWANRVGQAVV